MSRLSTFLTLGVIASIAVVSSADAQPKRKKAVPADKVEKAMDRAADKAPEKTAEEQPGPDFDRQAAATAISEVSLAKCKATNASKGEGHVTITFAKDGAAQNARVDRGPWVGTPIAKCMAKAFKKTRIPAFKGDSVTVGKSFQFE